MSDLNESAAALLKEFKGNTYAFGSGILDEAPGKFAAELGKNAMFVGPIDEEWFQPIKDRILKSLELRCMLSQGFQRKEDLWKHALVNQLV